MIYRSLTAFLSVSFVLLFMLAAIPSVRAGTGDSGSPSHYMHPEKGYSLEVPANAQLIEQKPPMDISIRSRDGWGISIQSLLTNNDSRLEDLITGLESRYLGPDKSWKRKLESARRQQGDLAIQDSTYDGSGMRIRVVVVRAQLLDYIIMFVAPRDGYIAALPSFERFLTTFRPASGESLGVEPDSVMMQESADNPTKRAPENTLLRFHDPTMGYSMFYPAHWTMTQRDKVTVIFNGPSGEDSAYIALSIQNVAPPVAGTPRLASEAILQQLQAQMAYSVSNVRHTVAEPVTLGAPGSTVQAPQLVSDFIRAGTQYRQWTIVIPRPNGSVVHVWTFVAPLDRFERYRPIAETMAQSWAMESVTQ